MAWIITKLLLSAKAELHYLVDILIFLKDALQPAPGLESHDTAPFIVRLLMKPSP